MDCAKCAFYKRVRIPTVTLSTVTLKSYSATIARAGAQQVPSIFNGSTVSFALVPFMLESPTKGARSNMSFGAKISNTGSSFCHAGVSEPIRRGFLLKSHSIASRDNQGAALRKSGAYQSSCFASISIAHPWGNSIFSAAFFKCSAVILPLLGVTCNMRQGIS